MRLEIYKCKKCNNYTIYLEIFKLNLKIKTMNLPICYNCSETVILKFEPRNKITKAQLDWQNKLNARINKRINTNGETKYDTGLGQKVNTREIDRICKEKGLIYGGEDLTREAIKNKEYNELKYKSMFKDGLVKELREKGF